MGLRKLWDIRRLVLFLGALNLGLSLVAAHVAVLSLRGKCPQRVVVASTLIAVGAAIRIIWMVGMGFAQAVTASAMIAQASEPTSFDATPTTSQRRRWYKHWLWCSRIGFLVTVVQSIGALYLTFIVVSKMAKCFDCSCSKDEFGLQTFLACLPVAAWVVAFAQCCVGSDVMAWRSLYHNQDEAWRAHYREMFDYGIREAMCCLGRRRYLSYLDKDEVDSVAALLGDLVAYRAVGASHLEVVAGVALLRERGSQSHLSDDYTPAPDSLLQEASYLHSYAVAAYTGPLLDIGRHPLMFPCVWLHRQGILTFWNRNRRPKLEGDNWWRGHAAAFLRQAHVPPEALVKGRVLQTHKRETVYFVVVLHHLRSVVVAVRGTETPEDLLTDGLGRECELSESDLLGLLKGSGIPERVKQQVQETMPHYGHAGVIQAARELSMELDNLAEDEDDGGLLTKLLGPGGECKDYSLRFVGHSLGGSIAALTALRLYRRYPQLHVYAYGVLPCVDAITADACASFITSVIYNDEFSSRLSVAAIMRLRVAALQALAADANTDSALLTKLTNQLFREGHRNERRENIDSKGVAEEEDIEDSNEKGKNKEIMRFQTSNKRGEPLLENTAKSIQPGAYANLDLLPNGMPRETTDELRDGNMGSDLQTMWPAEMFVPGLIIHLVLEEVSYAAASMWNSSYRFLMRQESNKKPQYRAILKDRESFRNIVVSPSMFLDHMPWRCKEAMDEVLKQVKIRSTASLYTPLASELV
ncbi:unnamed protein product [Sphagnum balticum]